MKAWQADLAIMGSASLWGLSYGFSRWGLDNCPPAFFLLARFGLALIISIFLFGHHLKGLTPQNLRRGLILGLLMGGGYLLQIYSVNFTEISRSAFITAMTLPAIPIVNFILFREIIKKHHLFGIILALIGLYLFLRPNFTEIRSGDIIAFVSVPLWALYMIYLSVYTEGQDSYKLTAQFMILQFIGSIPLALLASIFFESGLLPPLHPDLVKGLNPDLHFWVGLIFCALAASIATVFIQTSCQKYTSATQAMLCFQLEPVTATIFAIVVLSETVEFMAILGAAVILSGVLFSELGGLLASRKKHPLSN